MGLEKCPLIIIISIVTFPCLFSQLQFRIFSTYSFSWTNMTLFYSLFFWVNWYFFISILYPLPFYYLYIFFSSWGEILSFYIYFISSVNIEHLWVPSNCTSYTLMHIQFYLTCFRTICYCFSLPLSSQLLLIPLLCLWLIYSVFINSTKRLTISS